MGWDQCGAECGRPAGCMPLLGRRPERSRCNDVRFPLCAPLRQAHLGQAERRDKQLTASMSIAQPPPKASTIPPASEGPTIEVRFFDDPSSELARCRWSASTSWGTIPRRAGEVNAVSVPFANSRATIAARWKFPEMKRHPATTLRRSWTPAGPPCGKPVRGNATDQPVPWSCPRARRRAPGRTTGTPDCARGRGRRRLASCVDRHADQFDVGIGTGLTVPARQETRSGGEELGPVSRTW